LYAEYLKMFLQFEPIVSGISLCNCHSYFLVHVTTENHNFLLESIKNKHSISGIESQADKST
jgi:hypothetical protein